MTVIVWVAVGMAIVYLAVVIGLFASMRGRSGEWDFLRGADKKTWRTAVAAIFAWPVAFVPRSKSEK